MDIKVYWRQDCHACIDVFNYLDDKQLDYEKIDVTYDQNRFDEMLRLGGIATPLIMIDGQVVSHFDREKLNQIIEVLGYG